MVVGRAIHRRHVESDIDLDALVFSGSAAQLAEQEQAAEADSPPR